MLGTLLTRSQCCFHKWLGMSLNDLSSTILISPMKTLMEFKAILHQQKIQADFGTGLEIGNIHLFFNEALQKEKRN